MLLSVGIVLWIRTLYVDVVAKMFPLMGSGSWWLMFVIGVLLFCLVSVLNVWAVRKKVAAIWLRK